MKINTLGSGHFLTGLAKGFKPFDPKNPFYQKCMSYVLSALIILRATTCRNLECNKAFQSLPKNRTFADMFNDDTIWINIVELDAVMGQSVGNDIAVSKQAFADAFEQKYGVHFIASILVHELAHMNGVAPKDMRADYVLVPCGFPQYYFPHAHDYNKHPGD